LPEDFVQLVALLHQGIKGSPGGGCVDPEAIQQGLVDGLQGRISEAPVPQQSRAEPEQVGECVVFAGIMAMFLVLFRSLPLALIAITPNLLAAGTVLGLMGWVGIPLDLMTITIAAITIGIAVDDTIHFITRFREEFPQIGNYRDTMYLCHRTIGKAMFYTSLVIVVGFSILVTSNFIPSIIFGLLTALAMVIALIAALTLLPVLIVWFKPLGPEQTPTQTETASA
jgi:uncharacterized membrane protein YdfJ with MMPL/SSD domain